MKARIKHIFPLLSALLLMAQPSSSAAAARVDFEKDLLPVFEERCFGCHGPKKEESAMRADSREALLAGGDNGPAIIPGDSTNSILVQVLAGTHDTIATMPKKKEKLTAEQIALVRAWIDQGAVWESTAVASKRSEATNHWAFKPPARPALLTAADDSWIRTPVDNFVLARLEKESLRPSPEADKTTLLRRLCLDLTGLPPSITEADAFLADTSSNAYSAVVDRLLASPHYGERWGRHWLDAARYADSDGFEKDKQRTVWHYRDWVVDALNRDLSYDRFIIEQIAGDLLPDATQDQIVATGYLRNSMINEEGGVDPEQFRMEAMFDRMDAIGKGVLGLTIQCAQCHTHKFDPVTQEEYYRMFAFLNNSDEGSAVVYTPDQQIQRVKLLTEIRGIESALRHRTPDWQERMSRWEDEVKTNQPEWITLDLVNSGDNAQRLYQQPDGSYLAQGYAPTKYFGKMTNTVTLPEIRAFRLETFTDPNLPANGPGRSIKGLFALSEFMVEVADATNLTNKFDVQFVGATADFSNAETPLEPLYDDRSGKKRITGPVAFALDRDETTAWGIDAGPGLRNQDRQAVFVANTNIAFPNGTFLHVRIRQLHGGWNSDDNQTLNIGRFRVSVCASSNVVADTVPKKVRDIFAIPRDRRSPAEIAAVFGHWRTTVPEWKDANDRIAALWAQHPEGQTQLVLHERDDRRMTRLLKRGDWLKPADPVEPGVPAFLNPLPSDVPPDRLAFARWLVDRQSPTTARALVNRVWQHYFGIGLVETSEDLGTQSPPPSHPELLDWLAVEFMDHGWSLKHLHCLIVNSAAYRQSSRVTPELYEKDPYNRLLARGARFRVEGEIVRDISLAASGLLDRRIGGPAVFPPAPAFLFEPPASYGPKPWAESSGPDRYRRALYTFRYRSVPHPALQTFDAPNGDYSCVRRVRSNTPLQALVSLNEPLFMEAAKALALRILQDGGPSDRERVTYAFRRCLSRTPTGDETTEVLSLLQKQTAHLSEGWIPAYDLGAVDLANPPTLPPGTTPVQLAAWTSVSRVLLNLDETITRE